MELADNDKLKAKLPAIKLVAACAQSPTSLSMLDAKLDLSRTHVIEGRVEAVPQVANRGKPGNFFDSGNGQGRCLRLARDAIQFDQTRPTAAVSRFLERGDHAQHWRGDADEPPIRYQNPGKGKCATGYLWVIHAPRNGIRGDLLYQWHPSRKAACLDDLLGAFRGFLQTDAYAGDDSWADGKRDLQRLSCWTHARRKFHDAFKAGQTLAAGVLAAIQRLYQLEAALRQRQAAPDERLRQQQAAPLLQLLRADLVTLRQRPEVLPKSLLGKAIDPEIRS